MGIPDLQAGLPSNGSRAHFVQVHRQHTHLDHKVSLTDLQRSLRGLVCRISSEICRVSLHPSLLRGEASRSRSSSSAIYEFHFTTPALVHIRFFKKFHELYYRTPRRVKMPIFGENVGNPRIIRVALVIGVWQVWRIFAGFAELHRLYRVS